MYGDMFPDAFSEGVITGAMGAVLMFLLLMVFVALVFAVVSYVLQSLSLYTIAQRRGIRNPWLAWIPVGNLWILGSISDQYQYVAKGEIKNIRKLLLGLGIAYFAMYGFQIIAEIAAMLVGEDTGMLMSAIGGNMLLPLLSIVLLVIWYIAYYNLYNSCQPSNATLFLVLSIFFSVTLPFFVFACRKKDLGMPPRKQPAAPQQIVEPVAEEPTEDEPVDEEDVTEEDFVQPEEFEET